MNPHERTRQRLSGELCCDCAHWQKLPTAQTIGKCTLRSDTRPLIKCEDERCDIDKFRLKTEARP